MRKFADISLEEERLLFKLRKSQEEIANGKGKILKSLKFLRGDMGNYSKNVPVAGVEDWKWTFG